MGIVDAFPADWRCQVEVHRTGGLDEYGDPRPATVILVDQCLVAAGTATRNDRASAVVTSELALFRDPDPSFRFLASDQIVVPAGAMNAGSYMVDGRPLESPLGVEVPLKGAGPNG